MQDAVDRANAEFWDELCGTTLAARLGITDHSAASLRRFDDAYLAMYPYLLPLVGPGRMAGRRVLEIGLGYGTLGQRLAEAGADYAGVDLAARPVEMMNHRLRLLGLAPRARRDSALRLPFADASFDFVVSIGCLHHTGNTGRAFDEVHRVLAPGGTAVLMVYNKFSYREWLRRPWATFRAWRAEEAGGAGWRELENVRRDYDTNRAGDAAPETALHSVGQLRRMLRAFEQVAVCKQNMDDPPVLARLGLTRQRLLGLPARLWGLDIYVEAVKHAAPADRARGAASTPRTRPGVTRLERGAESG